MRCLDCGRRISWSDPCQIGDLREQGSAPASGIPGTARNQRILAFEVPHEGYLKWQSLRPNAPKLS